jgi:hypothetical protein
MMTLIDEFCTALPFNRFRHCRPTAILGLTGHGSNELLVARTHRYFETRIGPEWLTR